MELDCAEKDDSLVACSFFVRVADGNLRFN